MDAGEASRVVLKPHVTEKTFSKVDSESKVCFIVARAAGKREIAEAVEVLYGKKAVRVNTARTIYGKKAFVRFESPSKAKDLATEIGML